MEAIQKQLSQLTIDELRHKVAACGQKPIPITKTTRPLVQRRLAKHLWESEHGDDVVEDGARSEESTDGAFASNCPVIGASNNGADVSRTDTDICGNSQIMASYYAICVPPSAGESGSGAMDQTDAPSTNPVSGNSDTVTICKDRKEALRIAKKHKGARFKVFKTFDEADEFAKSHQDLSTPKIQAVPEQYPSKPAAVEKSDSPYRSVKTQDLIALRKIIESNDVASFKETVLSNPRYLITAGDTPTILQEGCRYNAMHVVAKTDSVEMCRLILETIQDHSYILKMYPEDAEKTLIRRRTYLVDLYLNSPEKGVGETPLHFASKFGNVDVAAVLASHPQCDKTLKNEQGLTADQIICSRCDSLEGALRQSIADVFNDHYFLPVFRSEDNCTQPVIGAPWSPDVPENQSSLFFPSRVASENPIGPVMSLQAFAGPMSPSEAQSFRRCLQTPPSTEERRRVGRIRCGDEEKGIERIGREVANRMSVSWSEYWSFLDTFVDIASPEGLQMLEGYLSKQLASDGSTDDLSGYLPPNSSRSDVSSPPPSPADTVMKNLAVDFENLNTTTTTDTTGARLANGDLHHRMNSVGKKILSDSRENIVTNGNGCLSDGNTSARASVPDGTGTYRRATGSEVNHNENAFPDERMSGSSPTPNGLLPVSELKTHSLSSDPEVSKGAVVTSESCDMQDEVFRTPKAVLPRRAMDWNTRRNATFILGHEPTKTDLNVWRALSDIDVLDLYPNIQTWKQLVSSVPDETRDRWPTPGGWHLSRRSSRPSQTPSPRHLHDFSPFLVGVSPMSYRHLSEPARRFRDPTAAARPGEPLGNLKARLFQE